MLSAFENVLLALTVLGYVLAFTAAAAGIAQRRRAALATGLGTVAAGSGAPRVARTIFFGAFVVHAVLLVARGWRLGDHALVEVPSTLLFATWCATLVGIIVDFGQDLRLLPLFLGPPVIAALATGGVYLAHLPQADEVALPQSGRLAMRIHIVAAIVSYGAFAFSAVLGVMYLILSSQLKKKRFSVWLDLPSLDRLERVGGRFVTSGFGLLTLALLIGTASQMATGALGVSWLTSPKVVSALLTWVACAVLVALKASARVVGRRLAVATLIFFGLVLTTYLGVPLVLQDAGHLPPGQTRRE